MCIVSEITSHYPEDLSQGGDKVNFPTEMATETKNVRGDDVRGTKEEAIGMKEWI